MAMQSVIHSVWQSKLAIVLSSAPQAIQKLVRVVEKVCLYGEAVARFVRGYSLPGR